MTITQTALLELLKKELFDIPPEIPENVDWDEVYRISAEQAVAGLVYNAVKSLKQENAAGNIAASDSAATKWKQYYFAHLAHYIRIIEGERELLANMKEYGIHPVILKGTAAAVYYPHPEYRAMGDIDFIVPQAEFSDAVDLMHKLGYTISHQPHHEDLTQERHVCFLKYGVNYELHHHFSHDKLDIEEYMQKGIRESIENSVTGKVRDLSFPMLPRLENGLVLLAHVRQHLLSGLGLRQVIDWMMYVHREITPEFWYTEFEPVVKQYGLDKLARVLTYMCSKYLGLSGELSWCTGGHGTGENGSNGSKPNEYRPAVTDDGIDALADLFMNSLLSSGNFGRSNGTGRDVETVLTSVRRKGLFRWLQYAGECNWEAYHRHKWLKPFAWIYQIGRYADRGIKAHRTAGQLIDDLQRSNERTELLRELGLIS